MSARGHFWEREGSAASEAAGGRVPADEHPIQSPEQAEEAVEAAWAVLVEVFKRVDTCSRAKCRRKGTCLAGWGSTGAEPHPLYDPTGCCTVMNEAEWEVVLLGVICQRMLLGDLLDAMEAAEEDGRMPPSFASQPGRKKPDWPLSWAEWLALDPVAQLKAFERESAKFAGE